MIDEALNQAELSRFTHKDEFNREIRRLNEAVDPLGKFEKRLIRLGEIQD